MKWIILFLALLPLTQTSSGQVMFAAEKGININDMANQDYSRGNRLKVGFHNSLLVDVKLGLGFSLQPEVGYIMKGAGKRTDDREVVTNGNATVSSKHNLTLNYLQLPVNLIYHFGDRGEQHWFVGGGPYVARLLSARIKDKTMTTVDGKDPTFTKTITELTLGDAANSVDATRMDYGVNALAGYEFPKRIYVKAGANMGFADLNGAGQLGTFYTRNFGFSLTVGRFLGCKCQ